jgi:hypothetical protein
MLDSIRSVAWARAAIIARNDVGHSGAWCYSEPRAARSGALSAGSAGLRNNPAPEETGEGVPRIPLTARG